MRMSTESDKDGTRGVWKVVHILVGETFLGTQAVGLIVWDHIDDKNNNHISNLRPVPASVNSVTPSAQDPFGFEV